MLRRVTIQEKFLGLEAERTLSAGQNVLPYVDRADQWEPPVSSLMG
jgi:hypothetical protein